MNALIIYYIYVARLGDAFYEPLFFLVVFNSIQKALFFRFGSNYLHRKLMNLGLFGLKLCILVGLLQPPWPPCLAK